MANVNDNSFLTKDNIQSYSNKLTDLEDRATIMTNAAVDYAVAISKTPNYTRSDVAIFPPYDVLQSKSLKITSMVLNLNPSGTEVSKLFNNIKMPIGIINPVFGVSLSYKASDPLFAYIYPEASGNTFAIKVYTTNPRSKKGKTINVNSVQANVTIIGY